MKQISEEEYRGAFAIPMKDANAHETRHEWLKYALHIREMEIKLYWTRTTYFSAFISVIFAAYGYVFLSSNDKTLAPLICLVGLVFSVAWFLVNKGSKYWQENWENHVDMLEDAPLYKITLERPKPECCEIIPRFLFGPGAYSVSRINQCLSLFVVLIWSYLLAKELKFLSDLDWSQRHVLSGLTVISLIILYRCKTYRTPHPPSVAWMRERKIKTP